MPRQIVRLVLAVLILASLFGGRSLVANVTDGPQHVVKPGETLSGIAAQYGLTVDQLVSLNGITDPDRLSEGQTLKLPAAPCAQRPAAEPSPDGSGTTPASTAGAPPPRPPRQRPAAPSEYVVQSGDTLSGIAKALGISLKALLDANELADPDRLNVGQKLAVPAGAAPAGAAPLARLPPRSAAPAAGAAPARTAQAAPAASARPGAPDDMGAALDKLAAAVRRRSAARRGAGLDRHGWQADAGWNAPGGIGYLTVTDKTFDYIQQTLVKRTLDRAMHR